MTDPRDPAACVKVRRDGDAALLLLDRPEALNALSFAIIERLDEALDEVAAMDVRYLLVTGAGERAFCAGADIKELRGRTLAEQRAGLERGQAVLARIPRLAVPSVAFVNGFAFGGGLELALACTFRVAARTARMGLPEVKLGLIPGYGGTQRLPRVIGEARALELILTGRTVEAEEAERIGLVHALVDPGDVDAVRAFAGRFSRFSLPVLGFARAAVERALDVPVHEGLRIEADLATLAFRTRDAEEGMAAFEDKRAARFEDR